jgi:glycosyltransferase involved in cell wall biosynthesis
LALEVAFRRVTDVNAPLRVIFGHGAFSMQRVGGVSRYFASLHRELRTLGVDARLVPGLHDNAFVRRGSGVYGLRVPKLAGAMSKRANRIVARPIEELLTRSRLPTIYHGTYFHERMPTRARPVAATVHDLINLRIPTVRSYVPVFRQAVRHACASADVVFTNSNFTRECLLEEVDIEEERVFVTPLGVRAPDRVRPFSAPRSPALLYVGERSVPYKNFSCLVEAMAQRRSGRSCGLMLFGGGELTSLEVALLRRHGLIDRTVVLHGSDELLWSVYRSATCLVVPALEEGFGLPVIEAMAAGCPVICSTGGALPEVAASAALSFDPRDAEQLADLIDRVVCDSSLQERLSAAGKERAAGFTWRRTAELTLRGYDYALRSTSRPR